MPREVRPSFDQFNYLLRPSKQVERMMIVEALHRLAELGFMLSTYTYFGMGSPYYVDFMLFHKYLFIDEMICVEHQNIPKRMDFNKPYQFIRLSMGKVSDILPKLSRKKKYLVWLDYDYVLNDEILEDTLLLISMLPAESIFLVTVNSDPRPIRDLDPARESDKKTLESAVDKFQESLGRFLQNPVTTNRVTKKQLPALFVEAIREAVIEEARRRTDAQLDFVQLFNYRYSDGVQMLSFGGALVGSNRAASLSKSDVIKAECFNTGPEPLEISVPPLTVREKLWLDRNLNVGLLQFPFELEESMLTNFRKYYRYYPTFFETLY